MSDNTQKQFTYQPRERRIAAALDRVRDSTERMDRLLRDTECTWTQLEGVDAYKTTCDNEIHLNGWFNVPDWCGCGKPIRIEDRLERTEER